MGIDYEQRAAWHWGRAEHTHTHADGDPQLAADHEHAADLCEQFAHEDATSTAA